MKSEVIVILPGYLKTMIQGLSLEEQRAMSKKLTHDGWLLWFQAEIATPESLPHGELPPCGPDSLRWN